jgi:hypothetical protein
MRGEGVGVGGGEEGVLRNLRCYPGVYEKTE